MAPLRTLILSVVAATLVVGPLIAQETRGCNKVGIVTQRGGTAEIEQPSSAGDPEAQWNRDLYNQYLDQYHHNRTWMGQYRNGGRASRWALPLSYRGPVRMVAKGRYGGKTCRNVEHPEKPFDYVLQDDRSDNDWIAEEIRFTSLVVREAMIGGIGTAAELHPPDLACDSEEMAQTLPVVCPRVLSARLLYGLDTTIDPAVLSDPTLDRYDGALDDQNNPPRRYTYGSETEGFDCTNVLQIESVTTRFDWEAGPLLITVNENGEDLTEGSLGIGGFYANFNFGILPWNETYQAVYDRFHTTSCLPSLNADDTEPGQIAVEANDLMRCATQNCTPARQRCFEAMQYLLHLGQHKLDDIGREEEFPPRQLRAFLPGPLFTKLNEGYEWCEWPDTSNWGEDVSLSYQNFGLWDWDFAPNTCALLIIWEGDGSSTDFFYGEENGVRADDFVGFFKVCPADVAAGQIHCIENFSRDMTICFKGGNTTGPFCSGS